MKLTKFSLSFGLTFLLALLVLVCALIIVDPNQTVGILKETPFSRYHSNFMLKKMQAMDRASEEFDTLIIGSSTSEVFVPADINDLLGAQSFSAATGGGQTPIRFAFIKKAMNDWPNLQRIIYIVDFFEFNRLDLPGEFLYARQMHSHIPEMKWQASWWSYFKYHFSHQMVESVLGVLKKTANQEEILVHADGTTAQSMILSPIDTSKIVDAKLDLEQKRQLLTQVEENYYTYENIVLAGQTKLNPKTIDIFEKINSLASEKKLEIIYILAPYQFDFRQKLMSSSMRSKLYQEWRDLFQSYGNQGHIRVLDPIDSDLSQDPLSVHWRDGIHFDRPSAFNILRQIEERP